jgi:hypothetical protein
VVFLNPVKEEVVAFFDILDRFGSATGLRLNLEKCIVAPISVQNSIWTTS